MEGTDGQQDKPRIFSRRKFLIGAGATALGVGAAVATEAYLDHPIVRFITGEGDAAPYPEPPQFAPEAAVSKEPLVEAPTSFGFNTHLFANPDKLNNLTIDHFKSNVDLLAANNQTAIRLNLMDWDVLTDISPSGLVWNNKLAVYSEAFQYAKDHGINVTLVAGTPGKAFQFYPDASGQLTREYFTKLAEEFAGKIDMWQIFNETDIHAYKNYEFNRDQAIAPEYLDGLARTVETARAALKAVDPKTKTTLNISRWIGHNTDLKRKGAYFFDRLGEHVDAISLDIYPDKDTREIARLPDYIEYFQNRYNKPVIVSELGLPTYRFGEDDQAKYVKMAIDSLKGGRVQPRGILLYELKDEELTGNAVENSFGFLRVDGTPKQSFETVISSMQKVEEKPTDD